MLVHKPASVIGTYKGMYITLVSENPIQGFAKFEKAAKEIEVLLSGLGGGEFKPYESN